MNWRACKNHDNTLTKPAECIESIMPVGCKNQANTRYKNNEKIRWKNDI